MSPAQQLHRNAMALASQAQAAYHAGDIEMYHLLTVDAFAKEKEAAFFLSNKLEAEPTRSILFRGAAQLAFNCGEYQEAERLIAQALVGNPPIEILTELRDLNRQVLDAVNTMQNVEDKLPADYLMQLRELALHVWIQPKEQTHLTAVYLDSVIEVLKKVKESFLSFVEIDFWQNFNPADFKEPKKLISGLRSEANPLLVNLKFSSFAASISSDLVIMTKQYSKEINAWKREVFPRYKTIVFEGANYESEQAAKKLANPYSPKERRQIFQPVVDLFKEGNKYSVSLTDADFREKRRLYKPVNKKVRSILIPPIEAEDSKEKALFQIFGMGDPESSAGKLDVIIRSELETATFNPVLNHIKFEKEEIYLKDDIELEVRYEKPTFYLDFTPLQIEITAPTYEDILMEFKKRFIEVYFDLLNRQAETFTADELAMQSFFESIVLAKGQ